MSFVRVNKRLLIVLVFCVMCSGCISLQKDLVSALQSDNERLYQELADANQRVADMTVSMNEQVSEAKRHGASLQGQIDVLNEKIRNEAAQAAHIFDKKTSLEQRLRADLQQYQAQLEQTAKGLVVTFLAEILFDSGKAELKPEAYAGLTKVAEILKTHVKDRKVAVEGHTDNEPIFHSAWASNWELSAARALSVVHFFVEECSVQPERLSAIAQGEFASRQSNETSDGRRQNRRVEIVILPPLNRKGA